MKITAFILTLYISFLTVQPVAQQVYLSLTRQTENCSMACCKHKQAEETKKEQGNCCNKGVCNPFGMCNCCFLYEEKETAIQFNPFSLNNKYGQEVENNIVSAYLSDCFHPPEIA